MALRIMHAESVIVVCHFRDPSFAVLARDDWSYSPAIPGEQDIPHLCCLPI